MVARKKILVTGAQGQLGRELQEAAKQFPFFDFIFLSRDQLSITDQAAIAASLAMHRPQFLVNAAAYTAVDKAESEPQLAKLVNATATGWLASACREYDCRFLHISTDYVYNGHAHTLYREDDPTDPVSVYGRTKREGEELAFQFNPSSIIIRTSWVYSPYGNNFVRTMIRLMNERKEIQVVNDQFGCPTYAADLAHAILQVIASGNWEPGIYHYSNTGVTSWYAFAQAIREHVHSSCIVHPIPGTAYPTAVARPAWSALDTSKITATFGIKTFPWKERLHVCLDRMKS